MYLPFFTLEDLVFGFQQLLYFNKDSEVLQIQVLLNFKWGRRVN